jgi:LysM domain
MIDHSADRRRQPGAGPAVGVALALLLAACGTTKAPPVNPHPAAPPPPAKPAPEGFVATPGLDPAERATRAMQLLDVGQLGPARAELDALLADAPDNAIGKSLMRQIEEDPRTLLGEDSISHKVEPDETLQQIAEKYLGDRTLFWALARYNGLAVPQAIHPGQILLIPRPHRAERPARGETGEGRTVHPAPEKPAAPPPPPAPPRDPVRAASLRGQALEALSRGQAARAVALLREASQGDPDSPLIKRDLERAERIEARLEAGR